MKFLKNIWLVIVVLLSSCVNDDFARGDFLNRPPRGRILTGPPILSIGEFVSVVPVSQSSHFIFPSSHRFQKIIETGDALTEGGMLPARNDFTGFVPINDSSSLGYLSISSEASPGGVTVLDIILNADSKLWEVTASSAIDFSGVGGTKNNCSGTVTPWNTIISCEERIQLVDNNADGYNDFGWAVEIDPVTKKVIDKRWALGNFAHENITIHSNLRTAYQGADSNPGYLYKFVADNERDLSSGKLFVYFGSKAGVGSWIQLNNTTIEERNTTLDQSAAVGATIFNGIEDVEIGPDGMIYFAVKGEGQIYRFQDSDPITGVDVIMETYVGNMDYTITHVGGKTTVPWGVGNDNLAFDDDGNLWVLQDGGENYIWVVEKEHSQDNPKVKLFGIAPLGSEPTGITFTPDYKHLFISIQDPDTTNNSSEQIDAGGNSVKFNTHISLVMARNENLGSKLEL
ncbi:MAG: twin-arginine translocation pathway signal protein [Flavobacteriaceae bacterium]|nr:MAG: twin-arginine translocation pathway signal protein [Flavobacteriaceae bacterium]